MAPKSTPPAKNELGRTEVKLVPDPEFELRYPRYYSNHIELRSTPFDFTMRFCDALPIYGKPKITNNTIENKIPIKAEVVIPKEVFPALIKAMQDHYEKYLSAYKEVVVENEKKK